MAIVTRYDAKMTYSQTTVIGSGSSKRIALERAASQLSKHLDAGVWHHAISVIVVSTKVEKETPADRHKASIAARAATSVES